MLHKLVSNRNDALNNYYLQDTAYNLGIYNRTIKKLSEYITCNNIEYSDTIDLMKHEYGNIKKEKHTEVLDISDIDMYTIDFELED